jgi:predicted permease
MSIKKAFVIACAIVIPLSVLEYQLLSSSAQEVLSTFLFYALFPGVVTSMLITGGHGGTETQNAIAPIVGTAVNIIAYWLLIWGAAKLSRRFNSP